MKIYLAAAYDRQQEMQGVRDVLTALGHTVTSSWIDKTSEPPGGLGAAHLAVNPLIGVSHARTDLADVDAAEAMISFTGDGGRGGRHIEFGYALARGKYLIGVGPREHIFHSLANEWYPDWSRMVMAISGPELHSCLRNDLPPASKTPTDPWTEGMLIQIARDLELIKETLGVDRNEEGDVVRTVPLTDSVAAVTVAENVAGKDYWADLPGAPSEGEI